MLRHLAATAAVAGLLASGTAKADVYTYTGLTIPYNEIVTVSAAGQTEAVYAGQFQLSGVTDNGVATNTGLAAWCIDIPDTMQPGLGATANPADTYVSTPYYLSNYTSANSPLTATSANAIGWLIANNPSPQSNQLSAATQIAIWAIEYGNAASVTYVSGSGTLSDGTTFTVTGDDALLAAAAAEINAALGASKSSTDYGLVVLNGSTSDPVTQNLANFIASSGSITSSSNAAPEPASMAVLCFALAALASVRHRRSAARAA